MNKIVLSTFATFIFIMIGCHNGNSPSSNAGGFTINGTIKNIDSGWVYLQHEDSTGLINDSAKIQNHAFAFIGKVPEPTLYHLWAGNEPFFIGHSGRKFINSKALAFFVEDTTIQITIGDVINKAVVSAIPSQNSYVAYKKALAPFDLKQQSIDSAYDKADETKNKATIDSLYKVSDQFDEEENAAIASYAANNANSFISAWAVASHMLYAPNLVALKKVYASFSPAVQQSSYGQKIKQAIATTELVGIGQSAPDFTMNDTIGNPVSLSAFRGKYVLVDFWAAWCPDCRRENPNVVLVYNKYKNKNFTILGVSLDSKKSAWVKAIHDQELTWTHVSDLKLWKNTVAATYGVKSIPSNFLIDPNGKIVGHNLLGSELDKALQKALQ